MWSCASVLPFSGVCTLAVIAPSEARLPLTLRGGWCQGEHHILWWRGGRGSRHRSFWHYSAAEHAQNTAHAQQQKHVSRVLKKIKKFILAMVSYVRVCLSDIHILSQMVHPAESAQGQNVQLESQPAPRPGPSSASRLCTALRTPLLWHPHTACSQRLPGRASGGRFATNSADPWAHWRSYSQFPCHPEPEHLWASAAISWDEPC